MSSSPSNEASLMGLLRVIHRWRRVVLALAVGLPVLTAIVVVFVPNRYTARGTILLEIASGDQSMQMLGQLSELAGIAGLPTKAPSSEAYLAILHSRRVGVVVVDSLGLVKYYRIRAARPDEAMEKALRKLASRVRIESPDAATLRVSVTDRNPSMAAAIANAFLERLRQANATLAFTRARRTRLMVENSMRQTEVELEAARRRMTEFQSRYGVFSLDDQTKGTLTLVAELQGKLVAAQTERDALGAVYGESSTRMRALQTEIDVLQSRIQQLAGQLGDASGGAPGGAGVPAGRPSEAESDNFVLRLNRVPELAGAYARGMMDLKVLEAKYGVLAGRLEQTKIDESEANPTFEVLDRAERPYRKSGPNRTLFVLAAFFGGTLAGVLLAVLLEDLSRHIDPETWRELRDMLRSSLRRRAARDAQL